MTWIWAGRTEVRIPAEALHKSLRNNVQTGSRDPHSLLVVLFLRRLSGRGPWLINHPI